MAVSGTLHLSRRALSINESATLAIAAEAKRLSASGVDIISLSTGEPDFPTPDVVKQAAIEAIRNNFTYYTHSDGFPALREAVARKFESDNGIPTSAERVVVTCGGKHALHSTIMAIIDDEDEVLIPAPYWTTYPDLVLLAGGRPVIVPTTQAERYKITIRDLDRAATGRTRALIINSPSNPTGIMYEREELEAIGRWAAGKGVVILSDELYEKIIYDGKTHFSIGSMPELRDLVVTVNGVSKAYAMTGWRIGFMTGPTEIVDAVSRIQSQATSNPCSISQAAAFAALTRTTGEVEQMRRAFEQRRDLAIRTASDIPDITFPVPDGAFYLLMDISRHLGANLPDDSTLSHLLLTRHHVAVVPGSAFGAPGTIRLSYACSDHDIVEGLRRVRQGIEDLAIR